MTLAASCVTCKGPQIPLRFGRVDAKAAGPATGATSGVPSPLDDVEVSTQKFASAGFSQDDMITLLACGHTLGRVHSVNLPGAFDSPPSNDLNADFDTTRVTFDNLVVSEFLSGNSKNPLVVAKNDSFNSDKRIFSINDRAVVQKLNDPAEFKQQCVAVLERMINTVPSNVRLSNPINLIDVKPYITNLELQKDGNILFEGRVRFRRSALSDRNPDDLDVALRIVDHTGSRTHTLVPATREQLQTFDTQEFVWYDFSKAVDGQVGLKGFDIQVQDKNNPNVQSIVISNGGAGTFPVTTDILYQLSNSCLDTSKDPGKLIVVTAVRRRSREGVMIPRLHVEHTKMTKTDKQIGQYDLYRAELDLASPSWSSTFDVRIPFGPKRELLFLRELANKQCEEL
ncbi:heme peroxidase [Myriangium duriaei CBS 260.36]|uniref:Peroxidase n=1 Tax=Myriangium duriaei CBS 260.36 TaxID=1168546 RepID=A0A9P4IYN3_9PEZI|nr:heme peroxidase [Myriangium duriaei CBS 260.36]